MFFATNGPPNGQFSTRIRLKTSLERGASNGDGLGAQFLEFWSQIWGQFLGNIGILLEDILLEDILLEGILLEGVLLETTLLKAILQEGTLRQSILLEDSFL